MEAGAGDDRPGGPLYADLRARLLGLGGVSERLIVDYEVRDQSPAFYVGARQLCHVHRGERLEVTISLSRALTFEVLRAEIPEGVRAIVERTREYGATRWVSVPIAAAEDVDAFLALARVKHRALVEASGDLAVPRDQRRLEQFA